MSMSGWKLKDVNDRVRGVQSGNGQGNLCIGNGSSIWESMWEGRQNSLPFNLVQWNYLIDVLGLCRKSHWLWAVDELVMQRSYTLQQRKLNGNWIGSMCWFDDILVWKTGFQTLHYITLQTRDCWQGEIRNWWYVSAPMELGHQEPLWLPICPPFIRVK